MKPSRIILAVILAASAAPALAQEPVTLRVSSYGGPPTEVLKKYAAAVFTRNTGINVEFIDGNTQDHFAKLLTSRGREVPYDVVILDASTQGQAIKAGLLSKLDPTIVTNLDHLYPSARNANGYGPRTITLSRGIAYDVERFKEAGIPAPTSWLDLWDERLAGKVAVPDITQSNGPGFLIQINKVAGGTEDDLTPGIEKIAELDVHSFYTSTVQVESLFPTGEIWAANMPSGRAWTLIDKGLPIAFVTPKEGSIGNLTTIDVTAGTTHPQEAQAFVNAVLGPLYQIGQAYELNYGPTNELLAPLVASEPELGKRFPANREEFDSVTEADWVKYIEHQDRTLDLWNRTIRN